MTNKEILTIIALSALGLCLLLGLAKMAMKSDKAKKGCDQACNLLVFVAVVLVAVSQLLVEMKDPYMTVSPDFYYDTGECTCENRKCKPVHGLSNQSVCENTGLCFNDLDC